MCVRTTSARGAVMHMPQAENTPESGGTITLRTSSSAPSAAPCIAAAAAADEQGEVARVAAALHRDELQRADHVRVGQPDDAVGERLDAVAERLAERSQRLARELGSHLQPAAEEVVGRRARRRRAWRR